MASVLLPVLAGIPPDGSTGNAAPAISIMQGTQSNPKAHVAVAWFDASTDEHLWFNFQMPGDYSSGGTFRILWIVNSTTTANVVWGVSVGAITPGDADTPLEHAQGTASTVTSAVNTTEAYRLIEATVSPSVDSAGADDWLQIDVYRDADNGSDTCSVDAGLLHVTFEYTAA